MINIKEFVKKNIIGTQYERESHFENIIHLCEKHLTLFSPDTYLDVGCGIGERTIRIAKYFQIDLMKTYGLDSNEQQIIECRKAFNAEIVDLETSNIPYKSNTFDLVICNQVLEHLKNYKEVVFEIVRVTKKNGYIIFGIPNLAHLINRLYLLFGIQPMSIAINSVHIRGFTHRSFLEMLSALDDIKLIDCAGSLIYPLPYHIGKHLSNLFVGLTAYTCYLLNKKA
jgi:ubiquinone/menaquinone biosynthesis C-methylase UbiE